MNLKWGGAIIAAVEIAIGGLAGLVYARSQATQVPTQTDYDDYRDVSGIKMPFRTIVTWTDGKSTIELKEVRPNLPIEAARFAKPAPARPRK